MTDRELDALVAERIIGRPVTWLRNEARPREPWHLDTAETTYTVMRANSGWVRGITDDNYEMFHQGGERVPRYSTDIAAAWAVVEHAHVLEVNELSQVEYPAGVWYWTIESYGWHVKATTAPRAICLAALRAVGVEVPQ